MTELVKLRLTTEQLAEMAPLSSDIALDLNAIADTVPPGTSYADFRRFVIVATRLALDPLLNEIHLQYTMRDGKPESVFIIHIDGYRKMAERTGELDGLSQTFGSDDGGPYVETLVYRKGRSHPFMARAYEFEYYQTDSWFWKNMKRHMLAKVSEALAYKRAFAIGSGVYSPEELRTSGSDMPVAPPPAAGPDKYEVGEIQDTVQKSEKTPEPPVAADPPPPQKVVSIETGAHQPAPLARDFTAEYKAALIAIADKGYSKGAVKTKYMEGYFAGSDRANDPESVVEALQRLLKYINAGALTVKAFHNDPATVGKLLTAGAPPELVEAVKPIADPISGLPEVAATDPAVRAAYAALIKDKPSWSGTEIAKVAALWMADQMATTDQLWSFLIAAGMQNEESDRVVAYLSISRYLTLSTSPRVLKLAKDLSRPLVLVESDISKACGFELRYGDVAQSGLVCAELDRLTERKS